MPFLWLSYIFPRDSLYEAYIKRVARQSQLTHNWVTTE